jgi:diguanylate cyclase (GGDEF)-like protein
LPFKASSREEISNELSDKLQRQLDLIGEALDASEDGFAIWKAVRSESNEIKDFTLSFMNKAGSDATGRTPAQLIGLTLKEAVGEEASGGLQNLFARVLTEGKTIKEVVPVHSPAGWSGDYENTAVPLSQDQVLATYRDVSDERREHGRLVWLTEHDYLTGMPNRAKLQEELRRTVDEASVDDFLLAFVFIDIDHFKNVNDQHGHDVGDALLVNFIKRIRNSLPEDSLVARIAGDEFAIVLRELKNQEQLFDLMNEVFNAMKRPFSHESLELQITCSAGCVLTDGSELSDEVMRVADKAMYRAKHEGRNRFLIETRIRSI